MSKRVDKDRRMVSAEIENGEHFLCINDSNPSQIVSSPSETPKPRKGRPFEKKPCRHKIKERT